MSVVEEAFAHYRRRGDAAYFGEPVSMTEHGLQAAHFAQLAGASPRLIAASLLHDIGHLIATVPDHIEDWTVDARHEETGARWLEQRFGVGVSEPVRLHVPAKRYLCAVDEEYFARLSPASMTTLKLQGGPMSSVEISRFEAEPFHREAVLLRRSDDQGKIAGLTTRSLEDYRGLLESLVLGGD